MIPLLLLPLVFLLFNIEPSLDHDDEIDIRQQVLENPDLFDGDMLIPHGISLGNAISDPSYKWPGGRIPYVIDKALAKHKNLIEQAMGHIHGNTCVRFVQRTNEKEYVRIHKGRGCFAAVGRNLTHSQPLPLSLGEGCWNIGTIIHELLHSCGFFHEQNRSDRDEYLKINMNNVRPGLQHNFKKLRPDQNILINKFDYDSIMIYGNYAFSKRPNKLKTMEAKNGRPLRNPYEKSQMTASDIERVQKFYNC